MKLPRIIINTSEKGTWMIPAVQYALKKHWPNHPEVIILGYSEPDFELEDNFSFVSIAKDDRGPKYWGEDQVDFFENYEGEFLINWLDDYLLVVPADEKLIEYYYNLISHNNSGIDVLHLAGSHFNEPTRWGDILPISRPTVRLKKGSPFNLSLQSSFWRTKSYLRALRESKDVWQFERMNKAGEYNVVFPIHQNEKSSLPLYISEMADQTSVQFKKKGEFYKNGVVCAACATEKEGYKVGYGFKTKYFCPTSTDSDNRGQLEDVEMKKHIKKLLGRHCPSDSCFLKGKA